MRRMWQEGVNQWLIKGMYHFLPQRIAGAGKIKRNAITRGYGKTSLFHTHAYKHTARHWVVMLSVIFHAMKIGSFTLTSNKTMWSFQDWVCMPSGMSLKDNGRRGVAGREVAWGVASRRFLLHPVLRFFSALSNSERQVPSKSSSCSSPYALSWIFCLTFFFIFLWLIPTLSSFQVEPPVPKPSWPSPGVKENRSL